MALIGLDYQSVNRDIYVILEPKNNYINNGFNCAFNLRNTCAYTVMYRTNIDILISAKCLDSLCTVCFLLNLHVLHLMECTVLVNCCLVIIVIILLIVLSLFASHPGFLSIFAIVPVASYRRMLFISMHAYFFFHSAPYDPSSLNLSSPLRLFLGWKSPETFPLVLGRFTRVLLSRIV